MNQLPYMPLYWNDFLADNKVRMMSNEELGAYFRLLGAAWQEDIPGTLPADDDVLARLAGAELSLWRKLSRRILPCFKLNEHAGRYEQKRMMDEHAKVAALVEMKHSRATLGAEKRWGKKPKEPPTIAKAMLKQEVSNASHIQNQNQTTETPKPPPQTAVVVAGMDGELSREETWRRVCGLSGQDAGQRKTYQEEQALYSLSGVTEAKMASLERYHSLCRAEPAKYTKPKVVAHSILGDFHAEVGKANRVLGMNGHAAKKPSGLPEDWSAFVDWLAQKYRLSVVDFPSMKKLTDWERAGKAMDGIREEYREWKGARA